MKKNTTCYWDEVLEKLFEESREHIANSVMKGITRYDKERWTAVITDWSKQGMGYFMSQNYCGCKKISPICSQDGWKVCMMGSSFTIPADIQ